MNRILLPVSFAASLVLLTACGSAGEVKTAGAAGDAKAQYEKTIKEAESVFKSVDKVGGGWAFTEDMMDDAKKAAAANDYDKALKLAKEAYDQGMLAKQQYESELKAGPTLF